MRQLLFPILFVCLLASCKKEEEPEVKEEATLDNVPEFFESAKESVYGNTNPELTVMANEDDGLENPADLAFHTWEDRDHELWVINPGSENTGGNTVTFFDIKSDEDNYESRTDGNAWHFMALATSLDFGENGNWATAQGILDANRRGGIFTGPTLWSSDMDIYAVVGSNPSPETNGSHLDMLHQSPMGMGIAHEVNNIYWVFDGYNRSICRYDFAEPHYPGGHDHSDGKVWRYNELDNKMADVSGVPSHMYLDKSTGWLYISDTGNRRIIKLNTKSGDVKEGSHQVPLANREPLALYEEMINAEWEVVVDEGEVYTPSGLVIKDNRMFVGDFYSGDIYCFDRNTGEKLAVLETGKKQITGLEIGPEGKLWFVCSGSDELIRVDPLPQVNA